MFETENIVWVGETGFEAYGDNFISLMDEFVSGYECAKCKGADIRTEGTDYTVKQISYVACETCAGTGRRAKVGNAEIMVNCTECDGRGRIPCPECKGTGTTGVAIPKQAEGAPTTGKIVSIGPDVKVSDVLTACAKCRGVGFEPDGKTVCWVCTGTGHMTVKDVAFKLGDRIMFSSYAGHQYDVTGKDRSGEEKKVSLRFLKQSDILSRVYGQLEYRAVRRAMALNTNE